MSTGSVNKKHQYPVTEPKNTGQTSQCQWNTSY